MKTKKAIKPLVLSLLTLGFGIAHAAYTVYIPSEVKNGGYLQDGSITFVSKVEEPTVPEEPVVIWNVELIKKTKYYQSDQYRFKETFNDSEFNIIAGGFDHTVQNGVSYVNYRFKGYTNEQFGYEFVNFNLPKKLVVESGGVTLNCTGGLGLNIPFSPPTLALYTAGWTCDGVLPNLVAMRPAAMNLKFSFK